MFYSDDARPRHASSADLVACRDLLRAGSKSFFAASLLLPGRIRPDVHALYAFCRVADDEVDSGGVAAKAVERLRHRLNCAYEGRPLDGAVDRAFCDMAARRQLPIALPLALIEGFEWDAAGRRYQSLSDVCAYGVRVAGSVGAMMTLLLGVRSGEALARACDLGVAMQLTNIARDIGEDARAGRLYLPLDWFAEEELDPDVWLSDPVFCPAIARMTARLLGEADRLYRRSESGIALLPYDARSAIWGARRIYADIGARIVANGMDSVSQRAFASKSRKLVLLAHSFVSALVSGASKAQPALPEAAYLVTACAQQDSPVRQDRSFTGQITWVIDLFERMEEAERARQQSPSRDAGTA
jgi:phytoene synthase